MREDRDYSPYEVETTVIEGFEAYEEEQEVDYGESYTDYIEFFLLYRRGFLDGGQS